MTPRSARHVVGLVVAACVVGLGPAAEDAPAQYFGRNKVQYATFDFEVLRTEHFDVYYYEEEKETTVLAAQMAERWYSRLSRLLEADLRDRQPLILYASHPHFQQTNAIPGQISEATGGVTEPLKRRVVLPMAGPLGETDHVVGHELVHAFQFSLAGVDPSSPMFQVPGVLSLPLWMIEGMAEYLSTGARSPFTAMWLRDAMNREDGLPTVQQLGNPRKYFPYRFGHALWAYVAGEYGDEAVKEVYRSAGTAGGPARALVGTLKTPVDSLNARWHRALTDAYAPLKDSTSGPAAFGDSLITEESTGGATNLAPSLSPDGERIVYLSERSLFSIEMYLADAETGEVIRKLTRTAVDPHFQSLQFINSAGAWSSDGERFAFAAIHKGQPVLSILDPSDGETVREIQLPRFGEVFNPTWDPAGGRIAFVGNQGGTFDLYVVDLESGEVSPLTDDPYAELHPDWSPDGDRIAFVTDRFTTDLESLDPGAYRLAVVDPESGEIEELPAFEGAKHTNPQWSPAGESLYLVSNPHGISNLYRLDLAEGRYRQVTNLFTGVSGITPLSPAISVASETGRTVISVFQKGDHNLYRLDDPEVLSGSEPRPAIAGVRPGLLPPQERGESQVAALLDSPELGLPSPLTFQGRDYDPQLALDFVSQPSLAFGASSFGTFISGGASLHFSDMLGYHSLNTIFQVQSQGGNVLNGLGAIGAYQNRKHRTNLGVIAGQIPELSRGFRRGVVDLNGDGNPELLQEIIRFWKLNRRAVGALSYPFSRVQRLEFTAGFERIDFELQTDRQAFTLATGQKVLDEKIGAPACGDSLAFRRDFCEPASLNEAVASAALVYDASIAGPTGPILGQRHRFELAPSVGTLDYLTATGDFRKYLMPVRPVTLAGRTLHFGRWGEGADDERLRQLYAGSPWLIRGYNLGSFDARNCPRNIDLERCSEIEAFNQLIGTRMAVANAEVRVPLLGPLGLLSSTTSAPPLDLIGFFDAGMAWQSDEPDTPEDEDAFFLGGDREPVTSAGLGVRVNLLGFAIGEVDWVKPFDRPDKGSFVQFVLTPGF